MIADGAASRRSLPRTADATAFSNIFMMAQERAVSTPHQLSLPKRHAMRLLRDASRIRRTGAIWPNRHGMKSLL